MSKIALFGEIMLRLAPEGYNRFVQSDKFCATYGGSEANVAVSLANFGLDTMFISKLPENEMGQAAINSLRRFGVDTSEIVRGGKRMGIYFLEKGASQRPSKVIYDRENSAIAQAESGEFNWDEIFEGVAWFHFTGITPALSENLTNICIEACKNAKERNITVSCDINYREKLWTTEKANEVMSELMQYFDICIANEEDAEKVFGIKAEGSIVEEGKLDYSSYKTVSKTIFDKFECSKVAFTLRTSLSASDNRWAGMIYDGNDFYFSKEYDIHIIDRVGGGDSFAAGLIYGFMNDFCSSEALEFATAASCLKHSIEGDFNIISVLEVEKLLSGDGSGRVQR